VANNADLVRTLSMIVGTFLPRCRSPMPLVMDVNLYYRILKLIHAEGYARWDVRAFLQYCPVLHGVWHAYKHCCLKVFHAFHSEYLFLLHGTVAPSDPFPNKTRLHSIEMLFAAVMVMDHRLRLELGRLVQVTQDRLARSERNHRNARKWRRNNWYKEHLLAPADLPAEILSAEAAEAEEERLLRGDVQAVLNMERLVSQYIPACFYVGHLVRTCHWEGRQAGSGKGARECTTTALVILLSLLGSRARGDEYVRALGISLLGWQQWNDNIPGCCYSEEVCKAALSRFTTMLASNPRVTNTDDACDVFLQVYPGRRGFRALRCARPSAALCARVYANLHTFVRVDTRVVTHVPWSGAGLCVALSARHTDWIAVPVLVLYRTAAPFTGT